MTKERCEAVHTSGLGLIFFWDLEPQAKAAGGKNNTQVTMQQQQMEAAAAV